MPNKNKVKFGLKNLHYAIETETDVYGEVKAWPGAVNLSLELQGDTSAFYADNMVYYQSYANQGYSFELETALIPEEVEKEVFGDETDVETGIMTESRESKTKKIAFAYQIDGDQQNRLFWDYGISLSRPTTEASTTTETQEPHTDTISGVCTGLTNSPHIRIKTSSNTSEEIKGKWFDQVIMPNEYEALKGE